MKTFKIILIALVCSISTASSTYSSGTDYTFLAAQKIKFKYYIGFIPFEGFFVLKDSIFAINFKKPETSRLSLKFDLNSSSAGFFLATSAMLGKSVLYAEKFPYILFESKTIKAKGNEFTIKGNVTIRGITKEIILLATLKNPEILKSLNKNNLQFNILAEFRRSDFKATGYSDIVGEVVKLNSKVDLVLME